MNKTLIKALSTSLLSLLLLYGCAPAGELASGSSSSSSAAANNEEAFSSSSNAESSSDDADGNNIEEATSIASVAINGTRFTIDLADNDTAVAFADMLPLKVDMSELNGNEKYAYLDTALPANATNPENIEEGDVMLYGNDCLVVFYKSHPTTYTYTRIGKIEDASKLAETVGSGSIEAEFEFGL